MRKHLMAHAYEIEDLIEFCKKYERLYIYGSLEKQECLLKLLDFCGVKIDGYADSFNAEKKLKYRNIPIELARDVIKRKNTGIILGMSDSHYGQIIPWLREKGFNDYFILSEHSKNAVLDKLSPAPVPEKFGFEVDLATHCNLNCQMCNHFSQLSPEQFLDVDSYERDIKRLGYLFGHKLAFLNMAGGEPLMHKEIIKFIEIGRRQFPEANIVITTNGLLLQQLEHSEDGNLWQALKDNRVNVFVTLYPIDLDYAVIEKLAEKYDVKIRMSAEVSSATPVFDKISQKEPLDLDGKQRIYEAVCCWYFNRCRALKNGHLYTCHVIPNIDIFNNYFNQALEVSEDDGIDIYKAKSYEEIAKFMATPVPFCRFCDVKNRVMHSPWKQSAKDLKEYIRG